MFDTSIKNGTSEEIERFVEAETSKRLRIATKLRAVIGTSALFCVPDDPSSDQRLVAAAIFAVLLDDINVYNQPLREAQIAALEGALPRFGLSIDDILALRQSIQSLAPILAAGDD